MVKLLPEALEVDLRDDDGRTPLSWAAGNGHEAVVKLLLEKGAELESQDGYGQTAICGCNEWARGGGEAATGEGR